MKFGTCSACGKYKYLQTGTKCPSCTPGSSFNALDDVLFLGTIGTGKTVHLKQHVHRILPKNQDMDVYIVDMFDGYDDFLQEHSHDRIGITESTQINPLIGCSLVGGSHINLINILADYIAGRELRQTEEVYIQTALQRNTRTITDIHSTLKSLLVQNTDNPNLRNVYHLIDALRKTRFGGRTAVSFDTDERLTYVYVDSHSTGQQMTAMFSTLVNLYAHAMVSDKPTLIAVDHATPLFLSNYQERLARYYRRTASNDIGLVAAVSATEAFSTANANPIIQEQDGIVLLCGGQHPSETYKNLGVKSSHQRYIERTPPHCGALVKSDGTSWERTKLELTDEEASLFTQ